MAEDKQLLSKAIFGSKKASEALVRQFSDPVYRTIQYTLLTRNVSFTRDDLEDLHNTIFLSLFENRCRKLRQYEGRNGCSLFSWIRMITVRTILDHIRKRGLDAISSRKNLIPMEILPELTDTVNGVLHQIEKHEQIQLLNAVVEKLPPRELLFIKLHIEKALSLAQVAKIMNISASNAYTLKHRAIKKLKQYMEITMKNGG